MFFLVWMLLYLSSLYWWPCLALCDPMNCSMPGFPVLLSPRVCSNSYPLSQWCHPTISSSVVPFSFCLQSFPVSGSFSMSRIFASGDQSIRASASASVLPMNIQGWFPLVLTNLMSLLSKGLSRVSSGTTIWKHQFFIDAFSLLYGPTLTSICDYGKNHHRFNYMDLCWQSDVSAFS